MRRTNAVNPADIQLEMKRWSAKQSAYFYATCPSSCSSQRFCRRRFCATENPWRSASWPGYYCCLSALQDSGLQLRIFSFPQWLQLTLDGRQAPSNSKLGWPISLSASPHVSPFGETCRSKPARFLLHRYSLLGDAIGHVRQMVEAGNFAPGNAGLPFYMNLICPVLAIALVAFAKGQQGGLMHDSNVVPQSG
jgi:hypothetical protein